MSCAKTAEPIDLPFGLCTRVGRRKHRFNRVHHVAPMCPHGRAHWRHLANMIEVELPSAHRSLQPKREIDRFSRCCISHGRKSLYLQWAPFPQKIAPSHRGRRTPSNTWFLGPTQVLNPNGISIGSTVFAGLTSVTDRRTDRQTDRPRYSVSNNRPHLRTYTVSQTKGTTILSITSPNVDRFSNFFH